MAFCVDWARDCIYKAAWAHRIITNLCVLSTYQPLLPAYPLLLPKSLFISILNLRSDPCLGPPCTVSPSHFPLEPE